MSGHSKWANIKHKKEKTDAARGAAFTKAAREIMVAARQGGGDPNANFKLRMAIAAAKAVNMPNDSISKAIKRVVGGDEDVVYEEISYEGYGPAGTAFIVECMTENRNRTAADVRYMFSRSGGNMGEAGSVAWMFDRRGVISIPRSSFKGDEDRLMELALEAGAMDISTEDAETFEVITEATDLDAVRKSLESHGVEISEARVKMLPKTTITMDIEGAQKALRFIETLEEHDDVQRVYTNMDIPEDVMSKLEEM
ncbi:MAG TPA: YebC/PmpR family DNA-binding transcriptional regulator [Bacillota bacterium]|nr:YebC/PmpR family DNA-binding transcriptional regulator [Bacillota bacterium]HOA14970.1 YebC/PmpR family DNA-binding transcriptional regulator [Bacillota bacterium]HOG53515.1 YebC/PmpR family DNA-binding transcriptional regulator [Bacillota bacterium]